MDFLSDRMPHAGFTRSQFGVRTTCRRFLSLPVFRGLEKTPGHAKEKEGKKAVTSHSHSKDARTTRIL
jgi:hypothetical protein